MIVAQLPTCQSACLFNDKTGTFQTPTSGENPQSGLEGLEQLENVLDTERGTYWAILVTTAGELQVSQRPLRSTRKVCSCLGRESLSTPDPKLAPVNRRFLLKRNSVVITYTHV